MYYIDLQNISLTRSSFTKIAVFLLLVLVGETINETINWGEDTVYQLVNVESISIDLSQIKFDESSNVTITVYDINYHSITIFVYRISDVYYTYITSYGDSDIIASKTIITITRNVIHVGLRSYLHNVNMTYCYIELIFNGNGEGKIKIEIERKTGVNQTIKIPEDVLTSPDPFTAISSFFSFLGYVWTGIVTFFNIVSAVFTIVWSIILFVFQYVGLILYVIYVYILPNLGLFIGLYFFTTLGMAITDMTRRGFQSLIDWATLWYHHVMALINFIKTLAEWFVKLINLIIKLIDVVTPFT